MASNLKPKVLHIGDPIKFDHKLYDELSSKFDIIRPSLEELQRQPFMNALKNGDYGNFETFLEYRRRDGSMGQGFDFPFASVSESVCQCRGRLQLGGYRCARRTRYVEALLHLRF
jgi:hypothetical protein